MIPLQLALSGVITEPFLYLSPYFESRRDDYLRLLYQVSTNGDWVSWLAFFLDAVLSQSEDARLRSETVLTLHDNYRDRAQAAGRSNVPFVAIDLVMTKLIVSAPDVARAAHCDYRTTRSALAILERIGVVESLSHGHPQRWWARELVDVAYRS
jgi:Fic family protein